VPGLQGGRPGEYLTDRLTSEALNLIDQARERPFYLNLCYHTVHTPIEGKPELVEPNRRNIAPGMRHKNATYAAMVHSLDENVGRVLDRLEETKIADRTVVVFFSDNGGYINPWRGQAVTDNSPLRSGKGSLYEGGIRVPLMIRWPGVTAAGAVSHEPVSSIDLYRTMLEMAGLAGDSKHNAVVDGRSLAPLLRSPGASLERDELFFHYPHYYPTTTPVSALLARDWKLIEYFEDGRLELYNVQDDPGESRNLAASAPGRARQLHEQLKAWRESVRAPMPAPNPDFRPASRPR
jgi:arylsulfatase A-like enzyme